MLRFTMIKPVVSLTACLVLTGCASVTAKPDMRALCADTVNAYAHARDAGDVDRARGLFTEDATVSIFGNTQNGRDEILTALAARAAGAVSRHIIGSTLITPTGADTAKGESYVMVIAAAAPESGTVPFDDSTLLAAGTYEDTFQIEKDKCRIATRTVRVDFQ